MNEQGQGPGLRTSEHLENQVLAPPGEIPDVPSKELVPKSPGRERPDHPRAPDVHLLNPASDHGCPQTPDQDFDLRKFGHVRCHPFAGGQDPGWVLASFFDSSSSFFRYFLVFLLKSLTQLLQQNLMVCPSTAIS